MTSSDKRARQRENKTAAREARLVAVRKAQRRKTIMRAAIAVAIFASLVGVLSLTRGDDEKKADGATTTTTTEPTTVRYTAVISTNFGVIKVALDGENAPIATGQFVKLARDGFYDGLTWHRAATDFVIQGGDPDGNGTGGSGSSVVGEVPTDSYPLGSIAAAKSMADPAGTFDSQFFIVTGSRGATLPNDYARFGTVVSGLEVAQEIEALAPASGDGPPTAPATIDSIEIVEKEVAESATTTATAPATSTSVADASTTSTSG